MSHGHVESDKRINLLLDNVTCHYYVIGNIGDMTKRYICEGCHKGCTYGFVHTCEQTCSDCMVFLPVHLQGLEFYATYVTDFWSQTCFDNNKKKTRG